MRHQPERVQNYTTAFLVMSGVILFMAFLTLAAIKGFTWVVLSAALIDGLIRLSSARMSTARAR